MKQSQATYEAIKTVLGHRFYDGMSVKEVLTSEDRKAVVALLVEGFRNGTIDAREGLRSRDEQGLRNYCTGLVSNWARKDRRLNGGVQYRFIKKGLTVTAE
jgi:hypothetical protein